MRGPYRRSIRRRRTRSIIYGDHGQAKGRWYEVEFKYEGKSRISYIMQYHYPYIVIYFEDKQSLQLMYEMEEDAYIFIEKYVAGMKEDVAKLYNYAEYIEGNIEKIKEKFHATKQNTRKDHRISIYHPDIKVFMDYWEEIFDQTPLLGINPSLKPGYIHYALGMMNGEW